MVLTNKSVWLIEVKRALNYEAIGQVLFYRYLLLKNMRREGGKTLLDVFVREIGREVKRTFDVTGKEARVGIAYEEGNTDLLMFCREFGIATFRVAIPS